MEIKVGDEVYIKKGFHRGDWGVVQMIDDDGFYHVAMFGDKNDCPIFRKSELREKHGFSGENGYIFTIGG